MKIIESAGDALLSLTHPVEADQKIKYFNKLLEVGFDSLDVGSFEPTHTAQLMAQLDLTQTTTQLLVGVNNANEAAEAAALKEVSCLKLFVAMSDNQTEVAFVQEICEKAHKKLIVYFGVDFENVENVENFVENLVAKGVCYVVLEDTAGSSTAEGIKTLCELLLVRFPDVEFGMHLHAKPSQVAKKVKAAYKTGLHRIDCSVRGFGNCDLASDKKIKNMATELVASELLHLGAAITLNDLKLAEAMLQSQYVFG